MKYKVFSEYDVFIFDNYEDALEAAVIYDCEIC